MHIFNFKMSRFSKVVGLVYIPTSTGQEIISFSLSLPSLNIIRFFFFGQFDGYSKVSLIMHSLVTVLKYLLTIFVSSVK